MDAFNRLRDPEAPHRVILLVNKGTEGWDCPSLFATALARTLRTSNNFVLQAASRCLRQVPGNDRPARIYLSEANRGALDRQLAETYGESLQGLDHQRRASTATYIRLRKTEIAPLRVRMPTRSLVRRDAAGDLPITFIRPPDDTAGAMSVSIFDIGLAAANRRVLRQVGESLAIEASLDTIDPYAAAIQLAANFRSDPWPLLDGLRATYGQEPIPIGHLDHLARQLEEQSGAYDEVAGETERELAIVIPAGFDEVTVDGTSVRQAEISYPTDRANLIWGPDAVAENPGDYGFHYVPYNFDSRPESDFFERVLRELNLEPSEVQDIYFTGAITDPKKTDLSFAYQRDGREHRYTPDFVVHAHGDRWLLVEVKMTARRDDTIEGRDGLKARALRDIETRNPGRVVYRIVFADAIVSPTDIDAVRGFLAGT